MNNPSLSDLNPLQQAYVLQQELVKRIKTNRILQYYPDTGPLRRELYVKHMKFFELGATHRQRLMLAANRVGKCTTRETLIDTVSHGRKSMGELFDEGNSFLVWAWDGEKKVPALAHPPFEKEGLHECYRITMADGQFVEVADHHRILCVDGWRRLSELLELSDQDPPDSSAEPFQLARDEGVLHSTQTSISCLDDCFASFHQYGGQPLFALDACLSNPQQPPYARQRSAAWLRSDAQVNTSTSNHLPASCHLSSKNELLHSLAQFFASLCQTAYTTAGQLFGLRQAGQRPCLAEPNQLQSIPVTDPRKGETSRLAFELPIKVDGNRIISITHIGRKKVYDFTVDVYHNYIAGSLINHNTEGVGAYELALHLTGKYPAWWVGKRFNRPVKVWAAGDTSKTVREIIQVKLLGEPGQTGTGLIPADLVIRTTAKHGLADAVDTAQIQHTSGGVSQLIFKSYDQRREAFQGSEQDIIWLDEEPPLDVYTECLLRTMTTDGCVLCTFTPLMGLSDVVMYFLPGGQLAENEEAGRAVVMATWDDVPHLTEQQKKELYESIPEYQRDARTKGIPQLGVGAIYPVPESEIVCQPFEIPDHWPRAYGMDVGWKKTAAVWGAIDRESNTVYIYSEHYQGNAEPSIHANSIQRRGEYMIGAIDPASRGRSQVDGSQLLNLYREIGLNLTEADNSVEAGIYAVWQRLSGGRLKIFSTCQNLLSEYRIYRRDKNGHPVKSDDHALDALRYLIMSGLQCARLKPDDERDSGGYSSRRQSRNSISGY